MSFRLLVAATATFMVLLAHAVRAERTVSFDQAKALSLQTGKPILLEFNHDDCIHCQQATRELDSLPEVMTALDRAVLLRLSVLQGEGTALAETYRVGASFPVFIVTDSAGNVFTRWTGYTGSERFLASLNQALTERTTIDARVARCRNAPSVDDLTFLANYFTNTQEFDKALTYCRGLQSLQKGVNLAFRVFKAAAEAVWAGVLPFDSVVTAADEMLADSTGNKYYYGEMAQMMASVARRAGQTNRLEKYLLAGIRMTASSKDKKGIDLHSDLRADYALHAKNDTAESISVKKSTLGAGWDADPARYFRFGEWCLRRAINLEEAERFVRQATAKVTEDQPRAAHLRILAEICYVRGKADEAITLANESLSLDPSAFWFEKKLVEWRAGK